MENNTPTSEPKGLNPKFAPIAEAKPSEAVLMAVRMCSEDSAANSEAILAVDQRFFAVGSKALAGERIEAVLTLMQVFVSDPTDTAKADNPEESEESIPPSMRRALPQSQGVAESETNIFKKVLKNAERLSERFIAGILLLDIVSYSWQRHRFEAE